MIWRTQPIGAYASKSTFSLHSRFGTSPPKHHTYPLLSSSRKYILHRIQQHLLGLHCVLLMNCQFLCTIWIWNHHLNVIFEIILFEGQKNPRLQGPEICSPLQPLLNSKSAHHRVQKRAQISATCVSRDDSLSLEPML
jgi:hypothetical protein